MPIRSYSTLRQSSGVGLETFLYFTTSPTFIAATFGNYFQLVCWAPHAAITHAMGSKPCNLNKILIHHCVIHIEHDTKTKFKWTRIDYQIAD